MFSVDPRDETVEEVLRDVFSEGPHDAALEGRLGEVFSTRSVLRFYERELAAI
jgi:hypothetical protein